MIWYRLFWVLWAGFFLTATFQSNNSVYSATLGPRLLFLSLALTGIYWLLKS